MTLLHVFDISKTFGEIRSLRDINFNVNDGEIVGLLGDNGAGKSTLIKIITGYLQPDPGAHIFWNGEMIDRMSVPLSRKLGIETVYQERALADGLAIWQNIFMGRELVNRLGFLRSKRMQEETQRLMDGIGFTSHAVKPKTTIKTMSGGERQGVAIARALYFDARLVILDEPTMGLSVSETRKVLEFVLALKEAGKSCIIIDHNILHVLPVADRICVLDRGRMVDHIKKGEYTLDELVNHLAEIASTNHEKGEKNED